MRRAGHSWQWQAADGVIGKSRFEGDARGPNPTDRAKPGTKKSVIVEQSGGPLGVIWLVSGCRGSCVGMYLRATQRRRKDGSLVRYGQLAHNRRVNGVTQAEVLLNLGREDELDLEGLRRLAASITRFTDDDGGGTGLPGAPGEFDVLSSRPLGGCGC